VRAIELQTKQSTEQESKITLARGQIYPAWPSRNPQTNTGKKKQRSNEIYSVQAAAMLIDQRDERHVRCK
jgi:hypothetical protein